MSPQATNAFTPARAFRVLLKGVAFAGAASLAVVQTSSAQRRGTIEIAAALGAYVPTSQLPSVTIGYADCAEDAGGVCRPFSNMGQRAPAVGGRVTAWLSDGGAIEGSLWYAPSGRRTGLVGDEFDESGHIVVASVRGVLNLAPHAPSNAGLLTGGPAVFLRSGSYGTSYTGVGGVLGFAVDVPSGRRFRLRPSIEDYLYRLTARQYANRSSNFHQDFVFSLSLSRVGHRGERR